MFAPKGETRKTVRKGKIVKNDFREIPITRPINPNTNRLEGDDTGYRNIPASPLDFENPDPMVVLEDDLAYPLYSIGYTPGLSAVYTRILVGPNKILVREPVARGLREANALLKPYGRALKVVDGWRPWWRQTPMWTGLRNEIVRSNGLYNRPLSIYDEVSVGMKTDEVCSYSRVVISDKFEIAKHDLIHGDRSEELAVAAQQFKQTPEEVATLYLTFLANLGQNDLEIDQDAVTAHGNGGAIDVWMVDTTTGRWVNLGVPYDYFPAPGTEISPSVMNFFDIPEVDWKVYAEAVRIDSTLQRYLHELGYAKVTKKVFHQAQSERRLLYRVMTQCGASYFSLGKEQGEPWHFQFGNERGGNQASVSGLEGSGNACHAILRGLSQAAWSNSVGHQLAVRDFGFSPIRNPST